jgi:tetratricopeptide (TPR) repeat protein
MTDYQTFLTKLHQNLNTLREREAKYGGNAPLELLNQIEDHQKAIALTEQALAGQLSEAEWREALAPLNLSLTQTTNIFQVFVHSLPRPLLIGLGVALIIILGVGVANLEPVRVAMFATATATITPTPTANPTPTPTPLPFAPAAKDETLILIATFHHTEGVTDTDAHNEIRRAIAAAIAELEITNLRVEVEPTRLTGDNQAGAKMLGEQYGASIVIWGADTGVRVTVNFLNLKEPDYDAAEVQISETERAQLANPEAYAHFITNDLPGQLTFLALFAVGQSYFTQTDYAAALRVIARAIAALPTQLAPPQGAAEAYFRLGWLYQNQGDIQQTLANYNKAIELDPKNSLAYNNRGLVYDKQGDYQQAISDYSQAIELAPTNFAAFTNRGVVYYRQGNYQQAIADYNQALELNPQNATAYYNRGLTYAAQDNLQQAITDYTKALELTPQDGDIYYNRAEAYANQGDYEQAIRDYTKVLELEPQEAADAANNRGDVYAAQGDYSQAITDYTKAVEIDPDYVLSWNSLCRVNSLVGSPAKGMEACERAVELAPDVGAVHDSRGLARALTGDYPGAVEDFKLFVEWSKQNDLYESYGRKREAWIAELEAGRSPFDEATLEALRNE